METSTYDLYLLIITLAAKEFSLISIQTDNTLIILTEKFSRKKQHTLEEANFKAKPKTHLEASNLLEFNSAKIILDSNRVLLH
jgi:hypothetical protein